VGYVEWWFRVAREVVALLLDLDDTALDASEAHESVWQRWGEDVGLDWRIFHQLKGRGAADKMRDLAPHLDAEEEAARITWLQSQVAEGIRAYEGAAWLLASEWPVAIVTGTGEAAALAWLRAAGLPRPRVLVAGDQVAHSKPHPEPYREGARRLGVRPEDCVAIDNDPDGIRSAVAAGVGWVVGVATTASQGALEAVGAHVVVPSLGVYLARYLGWSGESLWTGGRRGFSWRGLR
jgi:mannitol-1-/sugar-/sorbitol-6-phosphatase